jgi:hypothetical protein
MSDETNNNKSDSTDSKPTSPDKISLGEIDKEVADILAQNILDQISEPESSLAKSNNTDSNSGVKFESSENLDKNCQVDEKTKIQIINEAINETIQEPLKLPNKKQDITTMFPTNTTTTQNFSNIELIEPSNQSNLKSIQLNFKMIKIICNIIFQTFSN